MPQHSWIWVCSPDGTSEEGRVLSQQALHGRELDRD